MATSPKEAVANMAGKLWRILAREPDTFTQVEAAAVTRLVRSHNELPEDAKSREGLTACGDFLEHLASAASILRVPVACRRYRASFTANYRAIFPDGERKYRVDVLEGCLEQPAFIWVNGDQFELGSETLACADALHSAWANLGALLDRWPESANAAADETIPKRQELMEALRSFDAAWASLEHLYITELIQIEGKARFMVVEAIDLEKRLSLLESGSKVSGPSASPNPGLDAASTLAQAQYDLVQCICRLNSVANHRGKGRDDLGVDILVAAKQVILEKRGADAASVLAADIIESFEAVRRYLQQVESCLECVDPHLCNNVGLVARLVDWEESWEVGHRYVTNASLLRSLCDLVTSTQRLQVLEPALASMCEDCDVELFLVLPRLLVLRFLAAPESHAELLKGLLPHRFEPISGAPGPDLQELLATFSQLRQLTLTASAAGTPYPGIANAEVATWEFFARAAVVGTRVSATGGEFTRSVQDFMRDLEGWSVEVQRHHPEDWNQCSAVLVQCLSSSGLPQKQRHADGSGFDI